MALLHHLAANYHQRPSAIIGIRDEWAAYQFDLAVMYVGTRERSEESDAPANSARGFQSGRRFVGKKVQMTPEQFVETLKERQVRDRPEPERERGEYRRY